MERDFLRLLEGGCSAPIGAIAFVKDDEILFKGVLLSLDGSKRIDVTRTEKIGNHHYVAEFCANYIIERGGKRLMDEIKKHDKDIDVYATKSLSELQLQQFSNHLKVKCDDAIKINFNRLAPKVLKSPIKNVVITSQNAVDAILNSVASEELNFKNIYCVGRRTKKLIEQKIGPVKHAANNAKALANYIVEYLEGTEVTYFCSDIRLDELPQILTENNIKVTEIEAYQTKLDAAKIPNAVKGIMFFSPSTVESFIKQNKPTGIAFCIGETTAKEAKKYFSEVKIAKMPSVESVIDLVNQNL
jgi:uroporphyrinogen-III synthase